MKKTLFRTLFVLVGVFCLFSFVEASTSVNGTLSGSATWTKTGSPYIATGVTVPVGATLTVEPGTIIKLRGTQALYAVGTINIGGDGEPVIITTQKDDSFGGDSNNDGAATTPSKVDWCYIGVHTNATLTVKNTHIYYGGCTPVYGQLYNLGGTMVVEDSLLTKSGQFGVLAASGNTTLRNTEVTANVVGVRYHNGTLIMEGNNIHDNLEYGMTNTSLAHTVVDAKNTWWGDATGPRQVNTNPAGLGNQVSDYIIYQPWKDCYNNCVSNVMFFPGIMGSRLYDMNNGDEDELWVSSLDDRQERMEMNSDGTTKNLVYTKNDTQRGNELDETGLVDDAYSQNLYQSFLEDLRDWKAEGVYTDYAFIPYDWRLSLEDIVMNGKVEGSNLSYTTENTDINQSFLYQQLKNLQGSSKSGKVTLIGHSNGGLVIKAFVQKLKDINDPLYHQIDKVVLVAVPQTGTPDAVVSMLYGSKLGIAWLGVSAERSRSLVHNMPTMYNLLPSEKLFQQMDTPIEFKGDNTPQSWKDRYGSSINTYQEFEDFLTGAEGRQRPDYDDTYNPEVLSSPLFSQASTVHQTLDNWAPAPETEVIQIAGWGLYTVAGLEVVDDKECKFDPDQLIDGRPVCYEKKPVTTLRDRKVLDGDETVLSKSALDIPESNKVKQYWVDLLKYNSIIELNKDRSHKSILEVDTLRPFVKSLIQNIQSQYNYITDFQPSISSNVNYTKYEIHSPLHLTAIDNQGNKIGWDATSGRIVENIKGAQYSEVGEIKTIIVPKDTEHTVRLEAYKQGSFTLDITELNGEQVISETKFEAIPTLENSVVDVVPVTVTEPAQMNIDFDADGTVETEIEANSGESTEYENPVVVEEDKVAPEISLTFDQTSQDIAWTATDNQDENPSIVVTAAQAVATDVSGNTTTIPFVKYREGNTRLKVRFEKIIYNTVESIVPRTTVIYDWKLKQNTLVDLDTEIRVKEKSRFRAEYRKLKNETRIIEKDKEEKNKIVIMKPGFISVKVKTDKGNINWDY